MSGCRPVRAQADPLPLVERVLAFVRLQAFEDHLKRMPNRSSEGEIDPNHRAVGGARVLA